ncbi:hypothetical protein [Lentibacter sp.]|uniref:hypothetical protein n=1 Tax=Lentibacter sp. TaxID=2024994 RepID=UPI003F69F209
MKGRLNIICIFQDFWAALLRDLQRTQILFAVLSFFVVPLGVGLVAHEFSVQIPSEQFSSLISVYAIFSALLFGAQISAFSIFRSLTEFQISRVKRHEEDKVLRASIEADAAEKMSNLKLAFKDINSNISYLIMTAVVLLSILILFAVIEAANVFFSSVVVSLTVHLVLVLTMVVKQCHLIFNAAYTG